LLGRAKTMADVAIAFYPWRVGSIDIDPMHLEMNHKFANPAKVFDYMALGIPMIVSDNPTLVKLIESNGCGICVPPEDASCVKDAIEHLVRNAKLRTEMSKKSKELFRNMYNLEKVSEPFVKWLKDI